MKIDLNCDMGESFGRYTIGNDEAIMPYITSANIACGLHAGDPLVMECTVRLAQEHGVGIGAHPGFPDRQGFGRRVMQLAPEEAEAFVLYQIGALAAFAKAAGAELVHVKPHGALYNLAARDRPLAEAIARAVARFSRQLILVGLANSLLVEAGLESGLPVAREAFADRAYEADGSLRSRRLPGAVLEDPAQAAEQAVRIARDGLVVAYTGEEVPVQAETVCLHGDTPTAVEIAKTIRRELQAAGIKVVPMLSALG
ncbi:MAG TPA: LamB/YcsF family protein [Anaerolineae bacterium]|nr:LamB/YcsF family protein [Anaerolineae bacterium]